MGNCTSNIEKDDSDPICLYAINSGQLIKLNGYPEINNYIIWHSESKEYFNIDHLYLTDENTCLTVIKQTIVKPYSKVIFKVIFILPNIITTNGNIIYTTNKEDEKWLGNKDITIKIDNIPYKDEKNYYLCQTSKQIFKKTLSFNISTLNQQFSSEFIKRFNLYNNSDISNM